MSRIDRVMKLVALAGSANEHEARSAAHLACKLIREGELRILEPGEPRTQPDSASFDPWTVFREGGRRSAKTDGRAERKPPADPRPRRSVPTEIKRARRSGECAVCREPFEEGNAVAVPTFTKDARLGCVHADCRARWSVPADS